MKRLISLILMVALVLSMTPAMAEGDVYRTLYSGEATTLNYLITASTNEFAIAANVIDTLVEYDRLGQVQPSLAESWEVSEDGLIWTFHLRKGVKWVDGQANVVAEVTAQDFVDAAMYLLDANNASVTADIMYSVVEGAEDYYLGTTTPEAGKEAAPVTEWETVGVKAVDEYTLQYTLNSPVPYFLSMTTYVTFMPVYGPFLQEKGEGFGLYTGNDTILYNGAYYISELKPQEKRVYTKNPENWDAEHVYIDVIEDTFNKESGTISPELYKRGEIDYASIDTAIARQWLQAADTADLLRPVRQSSFYSYFYALNFKPEFDAAYEPENWTIAVNNHNFRKAIFHGLDRVKAMLPTEPDNPESLVYNAVTPPNFVDLSGVDYINLGDLVPITELGLNTFNEELAKEYAAKAKPELEAAGATFPIKILTSYNPSSSSWAEECQIVEQQLEALLGADFIDVIVEAGPSTGFLSAVRRSGNYALLKCNWGPDYADPETYTDPFKLGGSYNFPEFTTDTDEQGNNLFEVYNAMVMDAKAITGDLASRYEAFAKAEAYLINAAFIVPFGYGNGGYIAARLNPFDSQYAPFGLSGERYKGQRVMDEPMNTEMYFDALDQWESEREALAK